MAATLGGLVTAALVSQAPAFRLLARRLGLAGPAGSPTGAKGAKGTRRRKSAKPNPEQALPLLADAIVGNTKVAIARVFGPPPGAVVSARTAPSYSATFWLADTWYYPLPRNGRLAMAIRFTDDLANGVEFFRAPGL